MVDVKGDSHGDMLYVAETVVITQEDLGLTVLVNEENNGHQVVGEIEENNGDGLLVGEVEEKGDDAGKEPIEEAEEPFQVEEEKEPVEEDNKDGDEDVKEDAKEKIAVEAIENKEEGAEKGAAENVKSVENTEKKVNENLTGKGRKPRRNRKKKVVMQGVSKVISKDKDTPESSVKNKVLQKVVSKDEDKPESSGKKKVPKKADSMGMVFMCTSKTKKDCYRYKLLGLPAGKKDIVEKIYKGMRLFLFDLDLRLMYGIYKAAGPGGSNIQPKAFKSAFPSQVRFTVLEDCLPLAEEKFKEVIKDNYYSRNKFHCQLTSEQVKELCKLFISASKGSALQKINKSVVVQGHTSEGLKQQGRDEKRGRKRRDRDEGSGRKRRVRDEEQVRDEERGRKRRGRREERKSPPRREQRNHERPVIYSNEVFSSQVAPVAPVHGGYQLPAPVYNTYERSLDMNPYRRGPVLEHRSLQRVDLEPRHHDEIKNPDPYISYREREAPSFRRPIYSSASEREYYTPAVLSAAAAAAAYLPVGRESERHSTSGLRDYYQLETLPSEYLRSRREVEYLPSRREVEYRATADLPAEYHSTRALQAEYHGSRSLLAEYRAAGLPTEDLAPAGLSNGYRQVGPATDYRSSAGALRDYHSLRSMPRY